MPAFLFSQEIKPGITITEENFQDYLPELKRLLDPGTYHDILRPLKNGIITIPVVETGEYQQPQPYHKYTMDYAGTCKTGSNNMIRNIYTAEGCCLWRNRKRWELVMRSTPMI